MLHKAQDPEKRKKSFYLKVDEKGFLNCGFATTKT